jgi:CelD/BcsL family acetyltransferase involved in cellulose biosynthesis
MTTAPAPITTFPIQQTLSAAPLPFDRIPKSAWERLLARTPTATPFSRWMFHRAWWDAYGANAEERYLACSPPGDRRTEAIRAIVPLMRRRVPLADGAAAPTWTILMGASYHADYATILADPGDLPAVARAIVDALAGLPASDPEWAWDAVDLRRLRAGDPACPALAEAFVEASEGRGWRVRMEVEDVCPVVKLADSWDDQLARLGRKERHEIRRKLRRAGAAGDLELRSLPLEASSVDRFIELHQARFGDAGLFAMTQDGAQSRRFLHRLTELEVEVAPSERSLSLAEVMVGGRRILALATFDDGARTYLYNAGMDPSAADLSPGVVGTALYLRDRIAAGRRELDFLRGREPYKYQWGAVDEPIRRIVVTTERGP